MRLYLRVIKLSLLQQTTYRASLVAGLATNFVFGLLRAAVVVALYGQQTSVNGLPLTSALTYVAVGQAMIAFLFLFGSLDLMNTVYTGSISADMVRPVSLFLLWMCRDIGKSLVNLVARGLILLLVFRLFYPLTLPAGTQAWLGTLVSLMLAWLTSYAWRFLVNLSSFWTPDARGIARAAFMASQVFSGFLLPLRLYPDWFNQFCQATPFPTMFNTSIEVYLGLLRGPDLLRALAIQAFWAVALTGLCFGILRLGLRRLVIQGG